MLLTDNRRPGPVYDPTLLKWSGIDAEKLPELVPIDEPLGPVLPEIAERLGLASDTIVFPAINDTNKC